MNDWRSIPGFDGYEVNSIGEVRSWRPRNKDCGPPAEPRQMTGTVSTPGRYVMYALRRDGKTQPIAAHTAVLTAFVGPRPAGMQACHNDGNPMNNHLSNLRWDTPAANSADRVRHGRQNRGSNQGAAKLTEADILVIRELRASGMSAPKIAKQFNIGSSSVYRIEHIQSWQHVGGETELQKWKRRAKIWKRAAKEAFKHSVGASEE